MSEFEETTRQIRDLISNGGSSSKWFALAYVSWYRNSESRLVNLAGVDCLDSINVRLFWSMINLRRQRNWCESTLYDLERYAIEKWKLGSCC